MLTSIRNTLCSICAVIVLLVFSTGRVFATINYPTGLDTSGTLGVAIPGTPIPSSHHNNLRNAVIALETKVGVNNSTDPASIDYRLFSSSSIDPGHHHTGSSLSNINAATITTGTLPDARLSSLIPRLNVTNTWTASQTFNSGISVTGTATATTFAGSGASLTNIPETALVDGTLLARVADNETISGNWIFSGSLTASGANITNIPEANLLNGTLLARVADNELITGLWSFSSNIAQIRGVPYSWPTSNSSGVLTNDGSGNLSWSSVTGVGVPGGSDGAVQFNLSGGFGGNTTNFYWDDTNNRLGVRTSSPDEALTVSSGNVKAVQLISTALTGNPPFIVASDTKVTNLNVDLLDGIDSTAFAVLSDNETVSGVWTFSANIAQIRSVPYSWPTSNSSGVLTNDGSGNLSWSAVSAAGTSGAVQFNLSGSLGANTTNFYWDDTNNRLGVRTSSPDEALTVSSGNVKAVQLISTALTGNPPFIVASDTKVTNLNVDLLDGIDSTAFAVLSDNETVSGVWTFSANIAQIRGVPYSWPTSNSVGFLRNDGSGNLTWTNVTPGGATGSVQFNSSGSFTGDATTFFWDNTNKRLGLGTASPSTRLHVSGTITVDNTIQNTASLNVTGAGLNLSASGANSIVLNTNSVDRMRILDTGVVVFGSQTTPIIPAQTIIGYDGPNMFLMNASGTNVPNLRFYRMGGSLSSPTNETVAGYTMGVIYFGSYDGSSFQFQSGIASNTTQTWSGTARGSDVSILATETGSTTMQTAAVISPGSYVFGVDGISRTFTFGGGTTGDDATTASFVSGSGTPASSIVQLRRGSTIGTRWVYSDSGVFIDFAPDLVFRSSPTSPVERARITTGGTFEVRGTSPGLRIYGTTSGNVTMTVPASVTTYTLTLPSYAGSTGSFLYNTGSGALNWSPSLFFHFVSVTTTDGSLTPIYNTSTSTNTAHQVFTRLVARRTDSGSEAGSYQCVCTFRNIGGTLTEIGDTCYTEQEDSAASSWTVSCSAIGSSIFVNVTGQTSKTIGWNGHVQHLTGIY